MNAVHVHLIVNHLPMAATLFGCILLAYGWTKKSEPLVNAALCTFMAAAAVVAVVYFTGAEAEDVLLPAYGLKATRIHAHSLAGELTVYACAANGLIAYAAYELYRERKPAASKVILALAVVSVAVTVMMIWTGWSGARIVRID